MHQESEQFPSMVHLIKATLQHALQEKTKTWFIVCHRLWYKCSCWGNFRAPWGPWWQSWISVHSSPGKMLCPVLSSRGFESWYCYQSCICCHLSLWPSELSKCPIDKMWNRSKLKTGLAHYWRPLPKADITACLWTKFFAQHKHPSVFLPNSYFSALNDIIKT
jgi:hypothetical protein